MDYKCTYNRLKVVLLASLRKLMGKVKADWLTLPCVYRIKKLLKMLKKTSIWSNIYLVLTIRWLKISDCFGFVVENML